MKVFALLVLVCLALVAVASSAAVKSSAASPVHAKLERRKRREVSSKFSSQVVSKPTETDSTSVVASESTKLDLRGPLSVIGTCYCRLYLPCQSTHCLILFVEYLHRFFDTL